MISKKQTHSAHACMHKQGREYNSSKEYRDGIKSIGNNGVWCISFSEYVENNCSNNTSPILPTHGASISFMCTYDTYGGNIGLVLSIYYCVCVLGVSITVKGKLCLENIAAMNALLQSQFSYTINSCYIPPSFLTLKCRKNMLSTSITVAKE